MKNLFTLLIGIILFVTANAQTPQLNWAKSFNGKSASTDSTSVIKMYFLDKSIYVAGTSDAYGKANDIILIKRNYVTGDTLWTRHYNGPANGDDQAVDMEINQTTGDVYVTGKSMGLGTGYDIVTLKYSSKGSLLWSIRWDNSTAHNDDIPKNIGIDGEGYIFVTATTKSTYNYKLLVLCYYGSSDLLDDINTELIRWFDLYDNDVLNCNAEVNNNGELFIAGELMYINTTSIWSIPFLTSYHVVYPTYSGPYINNYYQSTIWGNGNIVLFYPPTHALGTNDFNYFNAMAVDNSKNVYIATLTDTIVGLGNYYNMVFSKVNSSGGVVWEKRIKEGNSNLINIRVNSLKVDLNNSNVYAVGYEKNSSGNLDWFVIKYNSSGVLQWRVTKNGTANGNDIPYDIAFDEFQNPVVVGTTKNTGTNNDITFVKYNKTNGAELFSVNYDSNNGDEKAYNIIVDANQNIIINGIVNTASQSQNMITLRYCNPLETPTVTQEITLNNIKYLRSNVTTGNQWYNKDGLIVGATTRDYTPTTSGDYYVIVSVNGCTSNSSNAMAFIPTGINPTELAKSIKIYPNPVTNELTIELEGNTTKTNFEILNSLGQVVYNGNIVEKTVVQTASFTPGIYIIKLESGKTFEFKKIIKK